MIKKLCVFLAIFFVAAQVSASDFFTGQKAAACECVLCLSTGSPPHECKDSLKKYFKIMVKSSLGVLNPKKTLEARKNFLKLCPDVSEEDIDRVNTSKNVKEYSEWEEGQIEQPKSQACLDYCQGHGECLAKAQICLN